MLNVKNLKKHFGGVKAVDGVSLELEKGKIIGLIGPNGSGKTTIVNLITGMLRPDAGEIYFKNKRIDGLKPHEISQMGIGRTWQIFRVFAGITTLKNLFIPRVWRREEKLTDIEKSCIEALKSFDLYHMKDELGGSLSGGQQKLLDLARVSMLDPSLFLLDEPFYGIHPKIKGKIKDSIRTMNKEEDKTFIVISHDIPSIMEICERIVVLVSGKFIASGPPKEVRKNEKVIEAYLGL